MRAVYFVKKLQWDLPGTVFRHGLTIGDVDNDGENELVVGTAEGELYIFKGSELWQKIKGLGFVTCVAIGDIFNYGRNALVVICGDGWAHIYYSPRSMNPNSGPLITVGNNHLMNKKINYSDVFKTVISPTNVDASFNIGFDHTVSSGELNDLSGKMECVHVQRIPTNTKVVLIADVDKDNANEMIIGLTDRVVRSYRWLSDAEVGTGKLVGLNKWECANQIGTVTLQHTSNDTPMLLVAQPGGTFMRIKCNPDDCCLEETLDANNEIAASYVDYQSVGISRMRNPNISTEILGDLEPGPEKIDNDAGRENREGKDIKLSPQKLTEYSGSEKSFGVDQIDGNVLSGNVIFGKSKSSIDKMPTFLLYEDSSSCNVEIHKHNNNEEFKKERIQTNTSVCSGHNSCLSKTKPYALATLDGSIILMKDETISWAMQVDHHIFALCRLDVTQDGADEIIACAWDGQTYILDQQRNSVRFHFDEPVRAFCTGMYNVNSGSSTPCFVYNTFNNKVFLYYDVILPSMVIHAVNPFNNLNQDETNCLNKILNKTNENEKSQRLQLLTEWFLYGME